MAYKIETISVYEVFEEKCTCPLCALEDKLEADYVQYYLGNAAMLPEIRVKVNKNGFCGRHLDMLASAGNKLPLALQMHTYLLEYNKELKKSFKDYKGKCTAKAKVAQASLAELERALNKNNQGCLICKSRDENMERYIQTLIRLYFDEERFRRLFDDCEGFCARHLAQLLVQARNVCSQKENERFTAALLSLQEQKLEKLAGDVEHFTKMFDYRNKDGDWGDSRTAVSRVVQILGGNTRVDKK